jgi:hypothetical protein
MSWLHSLLSTGLWILAEGGGESSSIWRRLFDPAALPIVMASGVAIIAVGGHYVREMLRDRSLDDLKRRMIEQGRSADEIERILAAQPPPKKTKGPPDPTDT